MSGGVAGVSGKKGERRRAHTGNRTRDFAKAADLMLRLVEQEVSVRVPVDQMTAGEILERRSDMKRRRWPASTYGE